MNKKKRLNKTKFPFTIYTWRDNFSLSAFSGLGYLGDAPWLLIFILPFILLDFIFRNLAIYKHVFNEDNIIAYYIFGYKKIIGIDKIIRVVKRSDSDSRKIQLQWKYHKRGLTKRIVIFESSLKRLKYSFDDLFETLQLYCK